MKISVVAPRIALFGILMMASVVAAQDKPSGKVWVESKSVALGVGVSWGDGKLTYQGKDYPFTVNGLSVVDLGVAKVTANGEVFNLKKLSDFSGNYVAGEAGAAVGGGAGAVTMKNQHGVVMRLTGTGTGVKLTLAGKGVDVKLKQ
ncbi:MAG TPA: DUF1134 domain-containing protein [Methylomirabilota bacterium]|nr:DUF1134 domain-containing protein [Methylomirabilota bacterium]